MRGVFVLLCDYRSIFGKVKLALFTKLMFEVEPLKVGKVGNIE